MLGPPAADDPHGLQPSSRLLSHLFGTSFLALPEPEPEPDAACPITSDDAAPPTADADHAACVAVIPPLTDAFSHAAAAAAAVPGSGAGGSAAQRTPPQRQTTERDLLRAMLAAEETPAVLSPPPAAAPATPAPHETPPRETPPRGRGGRHEPATSTPPLVTAPSINTRPLSASSLPAASPSLRSPLVLTPRSPTYLPTSPHNLPTSPLLRDAASNQGDAPHAHPTLEWMNPLPTSPLLRETVGSVPGSEAAWSCRSPSEVAGSVASTDVEDFASADEIDEADELPSPLPSRRRRASPALMAAMHGAAEDQGPADDTDDLR